MALCRWPGDDRRSRDRTTTTISHDAKGTIATKWHFVPGHRGARTRSRSEAEDVFDGVTAGGVVTGEESEKLLFLAVAAVGVEGVGVIEPVEAVVREVIRLDRLVARSDDAVVRVVLPAGPPPPPAGRQRPAPPSLSRICICTRLCSSIDPGASSHRRSSTAASRSAHGRARWTIYRYVEHSIVSG